jgi:ribosomal protein S18 acetylase RimI-like enzyme
VEIAPVTPERWDELAALFTRRGPRGGYPMTAGCWCMWWRRRTGDGAKNRAAMRKLVRSGREPGLLAVSAGEAVGWVAVAPREEYGHLVRSRLYGPLEEELGVWALTCFVVAPAAKRQGVASALLDAAVEHAFSQGASAVEAYPHVRGDYMGSQRMFARARFDVVRETGVRAVMRKQSSS